MSEKINISELQTSLEYYNGLCHQIDLDIIRLTHELDNSNTTDKKTLEEELKTRQEDHRKLFQKVIDISQKIRAHVLEEEFNKKNKDLVFKPFSFSEFMALPPKEWILDQIFGNKDIGMIFGKPGCGKTFVVIDMIINLCCGLPWAGRFNVIKPLNVAYCAGEGVSGLPQRFKAAVTHHKIEDLPNFSFFKNIPQFFNQDCTETLFKFISEWKQRLEKGEAKPLDLLVIDTLHTAIVGADENSSTDMGQVLHGCRNVAEQLGCAVIVVHHTNKVGEEERGSSAMRGGCDFMLKVKQPSETGPTHLLMCEKIKDGEMWRDQTFVLSKVVDCQSVCVQWGDVNPLGDEIKPEKLDKARILEVLCLDPQKRYTCNSLMQVIAKSRQQTNKLLTQLIDEGKCYCVLQDPEKEASPYNPWVYFKQMA